MQTIDDTAPDNCTCGGKLIQAKIDLVASHHGSQARFINIPCRKCIACEATYFPGIVADKMIEYLSKNQETHGDIDFSKLILVEDIKKTNSKKRSN